MLWRKLRLALALAAAAIVAACGGADEDTADTGGTPVAVAEPAAALPAAAPAAPAAVLEATPAQNPAPVPLTPAVVAPPAAAIADPAPAQPAAATPQPPAPEPVPPAATPGGGEALAAVTPVNPAHPAIAGEPAPAGPTPEIAIEEAFDDPVLLNRIAHARPERGEELMTRCTGCHTVERDGAAGIGPNLFAIVGAPVGRTEGFNYSVAMRALRDDGATWTYNRLDAFIANPAVSILGNRMGFAGMEEEEDRAALVAYVRLLADEPVPLPGARPPEDLVAALPAADAGPAPPPGLAPVEFTRGQVEVGQQAYVALGCATCHGPSLAGTATAPPLAGPTFVDRWFGGPVLALYEVIATRKPMDNAGGLDPRRYMELLAYLLHENGLETGPRPLRGDPTQLAGLGFFRPVQ